MVRRPEGLSHVPESQQSKLSSVFSFARRLKTLPSDIINFYRGESTLGKVSWGFLALAGADLTQVVVNRGVIHFDPALASLELISDMGMVCAADNLTHSPFKKLAIVSGSLGMVGSTLAKTGNPDLMMPALVAASISAGLGMIGVIGTHELAQNRKSDASSSQ